MTTDEITKHWDDMSPRERDAFGSEHIFTRPVKWLPCWRDPECGTLVIQGNDPDSPDMSGFSGTTEPCYFDERLSESFIDDSSYWDVVPNYSTDASADYLILEKVRETWNRHRQQLFANRLHEIAYGRFGCWDRCMEEGLMMYEPGDYIHAAWLALASMGETK